MMKMRTWMVNNNNNNSPNDYYYYEDDDDDDEDGDGDMFEDNEDGYDTNDDGSSLGYNDNDNDNDDDYYYYNGEDDDDYSYDDADDDDDNGNSKRIFQENQRTRSSTSSRTINNRQGSRVRRQTLSNPRNQKTRRPSYETATDDGRRKTRRRRPRPRPKTMNGRRRPSSSVSSPRQRNDNYNNNNNDNDNNKSNNSTIYKVVFNDDIDPSYQTELTWVTCNYNPNDENYDDYDAYDDYDDASRTTTSRRRHPNQLPISSQLPTVPTQALVLLPPASVERPTAILHFVGGTFFGSSPKLFYGKLLEDLVRNTNVVIVVTPIPIALARSPLNHLRLTNQIQQSFEYAWNTVLQEWYEPHMEEYDDDDDDDDVYYYNHDNSDDDNILDNSPTNGSTRTSSSSSRRREDRYRHGLDGVPLAGIGHSLGARLLTVLTTRNLNQNNHHHHERSTNQPLKRRGRHRHRPIIPVPTYKSMILISFTNFGANAGIPGVSALLNQSRKQERQRKVRAEREIRNQRRRRNGWSYDRTAQYDEYDEFYDDDEYDGYDLDESWDELFETLQSQAIQQVGRVSEQLKMILTPKSRDLEFKPSPDQLWTAMETDQRYRVNQTLVVQFDDDTIDQSSKLARILDGTNSTDVRFARLRGVHLSPLSLITDNNDDNDGDSSSVIDPSNDDSTTMNSVVIQQVVSKALLGRRKSQEQIDSFRTLRQTIVSYITDVVTK